LAHSLSAAKRHRQSLRRRERNRVALTSGRSAVRRARELMVSGAKEEAEVAVREAGAILDRAASKGVLHANNAARRKSRLMHQLHSLEEGAAPKAAPRKRRASTKAKATARKTAGRTTRAKKS
jgi:small subunit ribosomal protein S20